MAPPPEPERPHVSPVDDGAAHTFLMKRRELDQDRRRLLGEITDEIEDAATAAITDELRSCRRAAASIAESTERLTEIVRAVNECRSATRTEPLPLLTAADVIEAALGNRPAVVQPRQHGPVRQGLVENASAEGYAETQPAVRDGFVRR
jgi:hypothetical protein